MNKLGAEKPNSTVGALSWEDCRLLVESLVDYAIFVLDPEGNIVTWNKGAEKIKGYAASEIIGQHFSKFYTPEDVAAGKPERNLKAAAAAGHFEDEGWRVRKDGTLFWANVVITALFDDDGKLRGFGKVTRDLTQRRREEQVLRASEERFHHLVDAVTDYAIFMLDLEGNVSSWNVGASRIKGYQAHEIIGKHFSIFYTPEDRAAGKPERILDTVRSVGRYEDESWRVRKDGSGFWASVVLTLLRDSRGEPVGFAKVTRDLTIRRQAEETERNLMREQIARLAAEHNEHLLRESEQAAQLAAERAEHSAKQAELANRIKDEFLATVSHELRTPLNTIVGWSSLLRSRALEPSLARGIEIIHRNALAQARIIEDILDVSRIISGKLKLELKPTNLVTVMSEAIEVIRPSADAKKISISFEPISERGLLVADTERLRQVLWNLLSNSVKFTDSGGSVVASVEQQGSKLVVSVADTGRGIEPEFLPYVFDRFRQADSSSARHFGGLGLGLAIVRHIVELHGGQVEALSAGKGMGAVFRVTLPIRAVVTELQDIDADAPMPLESQSASLDGFRVLIVDDDADARDLLKSLLGQAGAVVETADSASTGFDELRRFRPHVLVSDIGLPGEDGYAFVRRVRILEPSEGGGIPSIALTAYARDVDRTKALAAGFTTHIGKPVNPGDLIAAVANLAGFVQR